MKDIPGYEGLYKATVCGLVFSCRRKKFLAPDSFGPYYMVTLSVKGVGKKKKVSRIIAQTFLDNPDNLPVVNHKDGNKRNNSVNNLEWCTMKHNNIHAYETGLKVLPKGKDDKRSMPVLQFDRQGNFIKEYEGAKAAGRETGLNQGNITNACNGYQPTAYGFIWKYKTIAG